MHAVAVTSPQYNLSGRAHEPPLPFHEAKFRNRPTFQKSDEDAIKAELLIQMRRRLEIERICPPFCVNRFSLPKVASVIYDIAYMETVAQRMRAHWKLNLTPIVDMVDLFERNGIRVLCMDTKTQEPFDGFSFYFDDEPMIVMSNLRPGCRQRFTLAHELGHLIVHNRLKNIDEEAACSRFAAAFLFPKEAVFQEVGRKRFFIELPELWLLKHEYGLSMRASIYRLQELDIISKRHGTQLITLFHMKGWDIKEPGKQVPQQKAVLFTKLLFQALGEQMIGEEIAAKLMDISIRVFRKLRWLGGSLDGLEHKSRKAFSFYRHIRNN
jgi:Zn-dependent peptidase ImmA (M78 family)